MSFFVSVVCSVLIGAGVTLALLVWVRGRLAKQFSNIERRLVQAEREVQAIKSGQESAAVAEQLKRLHKGVTRVQENLAERYGPLVPLAEELRGNAGMRRRFLGDYAVSRLKSWSVELGAPVTREQILSLAAEVARIDAEAQSPDFEALLAALIALQRWRDEGLSLTVAAPASGWLRDVVSRSTALGAMEVCDIGGDATLAIDASGFGDIAKRIVILGEGAPVPPETFTLLAARPGLWVYEKNNQSDA